ncbi:GL14521 [Drosophila persimilis]|uniref:GL14521 n=1 Tax=Drosophila persimilis TaxID=7234 RepID=B4HBF7_DROPE|nr:GL14521 [Drosophila persimilis]
MSIFKARVKEFDDALAQDVVDLKELRRLTFNATCNTIEGGHQPQIFVPIKGLLLIFNTKNINITSDCMSDKTFSGSMVIHYENCSISADGIKYIDAATTIADKLQIDMPHIQNLTTFTSIKKLSL